LLQPELCSSHG